MAEQTGSVTGVAVEGAILLIAEVERKEMNDRRGSKKRGLNKEGGGEVTGEKASYGKFWWGRGRGWRKRRVGRGGVGMN